MIHRYLTKIIEDDLPKGKIIILYGARQVGKTTIVKQFLTAKTVYYNCDEADNRDSLQTTNLEKIKNLIEPFDRIIIDEAQRVDQIGLTLKIMIDNFPSKQFIVTGSSAFDLSSAIAEPLTGRYFSYTVYSLSLSELRAGVNPIAFESQISERLIYGAYPEVVTTAGEDDKQVLLKRLVDSSLLKDVLAVASIKRPMEVLKILRALSLQVGGEVSLEEISNLLGIDKKTIQRYMDICEQAFILFSLFPYHSNKRQAVRKKSKYYFYDLGIRNALANNFSSLDRRPDVGALWENFSILERVKRNAEIGYHPYYYFWRSYAGQEIDLIEDYGGEISGFEFKYRKDTSSLGTRRAWRDIGGKDLRVINRENLLTDLLP